jgi:hypothetical protein
VQDPIRKPGVGVWHRKLPVWGLYARRVNTLALQDLTLATTDETDARPVILVDNVQTLTLKDLQHSPLPEGVQTIQRRDGDQAEKP